MWAVQPVTSVGKSIGRGRPTGPDLPKNSRVADTISTEATGKILTDPAQTQLVQATLHVTPWQIYA